MFEAQELVRQLLTDKAGVLTKLALNKDQVKACKDAEDAAVAREVAAISALNAEESTKKRIADTEGLECMKYGVSLKPKNMTNNRIGNISNKSITENT